MKRTVIYKSKKLIFYYLKPTAACQTKAKAKNNTGITGKTSTIGSKGAYASGNFASRKDIDNTMNLQYD